MLGLNHSHNKFYSLPKIAMSGSSRKVKANSASVLNKQKQSMINNLSAPLFRIDRITPAVNLAKRQESSQAGQKEEVPSLGEQKTDLIDQNSQNSPSAVDTAQIQTSNQSQLLNFRKARDQLEDLIFNKQTKVSNSSNQEEKQDQPTDYSKRDLKFIKQKVLDNAQYSVLSRVSEAKENEITACFLKDEFINEFKRHRLQVRRAGVGGVLEAIIQVKKSENEMHQSEEIEKKEEYQRNRENLIQKLAYKLSINQSIAQIPIYQRPFEVKNINGNLEELVEVFDPLPAQPKTQIEKKMNEAKNVRNTDTVQKRKESQKSIKKSKPKILQTEIKNKGCYTEADLFKLNFIEFRNNLDCKFVTVVVNCPQGKTLLISEDQIIEFSQIEKLSINQIGDNGFIFFWTVSKYLDRAFSLIKRWGYNLIDQITWTKLNESGKLKVQLKSQENSLLIDSHQICVAGYKSNSLSNPDYVSKIQNDLIATKAEIGNKKPWQFYLTLECMTPGTAKVELFSQQPREGWVTIAHKPLASDYFRCQVCEENFSHYTQERFKSAKSGIQLCFDCFSLTYNENRGSQILEEQLVRQEIQKNSTISSKLQLNFFKIPALMELKDNSQECSECKCLNRFAFAKLSNKEIILCQGCLDLLNFSEKQEMVVVYQRVNCQLKKGRIFLIEDSKNASGDNQKEWKLRSDPKELILNEPRRVRYCNVCQSKIKQRSYYSCIDCYDLICCHSCYLISCGLKINFSDFTHLHTHHFRLVWQGSMGSNEINEEGSEKS